MVCDRAFEQLWFARGFYRIAGIDEAGRGPLAGPVVAAAVILPPEFPADGLNDSKKLSPQVREIAYQSLTQSPATHWAVGLADATEIDQLNILRATHLAMRRAVEALPGVAPDFVLIDGLPVPDFPIPQEALVKGDGRSLSIAAASIIAKVTRDRWMTEAARRFPEYGFERHKGYPTAEHLDCLPPRAVSDSSRLIRPGRATGAIEPLGVKPLGSRGYHAVCGRAKSAAC